MEDQLNPKYHSLSMVGLKIYTDSVSLYDKNIELGSISIANIKEIKIDKAPRKKFNLMDSLSILMTDDASSKAPSQIYIISVVQKDGKALKAECFDFDLIKVSAAIRTFNKELIEL